MGHLPVLSLTNGSYRFSEIMKLFIDVSPAFYKTLLFNEIAKKEEILVIYVEVPDRPFRAGDFLGGEKNFKHIFLTGNMLKMCGELIRIVRKTTYDELIVGGYDRLACWAPVLVSPKRKNACIIESSYRETRKTGPRMWAKRLFFKRVDKAYVCGKSHIDLVRAFGFNGRVVDIGTVGLIRRVPQPAFEPREKVSEFLYVGRIAEVKNLEWLVERFSHHPELHLSIIGAGPLEARLKEIAGDNVRFLGMINNTELPRYYQQADVFVLPSKSEPYGLVVEEALNNGTPVLVSNMVGCQDNLVAANGVGLVFEIDNDADFENCLQRICDPDEYNKLRQKVARMDFEQLARQMINAFIG